jgi:sigma-B regulation protein RsbU (phosphoserine phosphatase)
LELARQVQQSVLPRIFPLVPGYTFAARSDPARWVGGDFYDVIHLDADRFALVIGDVSGKGMPAALYMAQTHSLLRAEARREDSPLAVLYSVHRLLQALGRSSMFVTVFYGIVEGAERRLTYARAGHDRPLLLRGGEIQSLGGEGTILGFPDLEDLYLSEEVVDLCSGDRLILYTDGLIDILSTGGQPFGLERLLTLLESHANLPPSDLCATTFADLAAYQQAAEQFDDMTLLVTSVQ